ncbi:MAG: galactokinase [Lachnospiraceae bacterium]|nr:galactokinase [Lachnospiraceae bacterium]
MEMKNIEADLKQKYTEIYGKEPDGLYFAPGRVNLIGEHTDYNGGHVFPCALTIGTYAAAGKRTDRKVRLASVNIRGGEVTEFSLDDPALHMDGTGASEGEDGLAFGAKDWTNYPKGVIWAFARNGMALDSGFDALFYGNIPAGSGLSSSASLEVLTGLVIRDLYKFDDVPQQDLALNGQSAENAYVGMNCGIMDQFASAMGKADHAIFLDTNTLNFEYAPLALKDEKIVITNSKVKHQLASSEYNTRRSECEQALAALQAAEKDGKEIPTLGALTPEEFEARKGALRDDVLYRRAKHAVYENARTISAVEALKKGDIAEFGRLMNASHDSLQYDYEVSCPEIDYLVAEGRKIDGVVGTRITGGGFGGCTVSIVKNDAVDRFCSELAEKYKKECGLDAEFYVVDAGEGAHIL